MTWAFFIILLLPTGQEQRIEYRGYRSLAVCERVMRWEAEQALQLMRHATVSVARAVHDAM